MFTLQEQVANQITAVGDDYFERMSARTRSGKPSRISAAEVHRTWRGLLRDGHIFTSGRTVFTPALIKAALPEWVTSVGSIVSLRGYDEAEAEVEVDPQADSLYAAWAARGQRSLGAADQDRVIRESDVHWALKHYIAERPAEALAGLRGGPWGEAALEFVLATHDRVDVVVYEKSGSWCLIEVKPYVGAEDRRWYAQAAKYRCVWQVMFPGVPPEKVRCVLVAPRIEPELAASMLRDFGVEHLELRVPDDFEPPPRGDE
ncbi:hypothetical protein G6O69_11070 [Pseudenhygromyxa sp. WMMC2535]|uniref:hypothetical protein n=1 Tax=Pseudenhygromyxa sp. WMMC2535 TaxID=2712867 RepID=UPI0015524B22|nr:hypothetical protein [Pseudenhygromyxa sp. WMMC2535]NVB38372.1 hypothetical protein [Pseudenhygromyxa sp. WMMC2535]